MQSAHVHPQNDGDLHPQQWMMMQRNHGTRQHRPLLNTRRRRLIFCSLVGLFLASVVAISLRTTKGRGKMDVQSTKHSKVTHTKISTIITTTSTVTHTITTTSLSNIERNTNAPLSPSGIKNATSSTTPIKDDSSDPPNYSTDMPKTNNTPGNDVNLKNITASATTDVSAVMKFSGPSKNASESGDVNGTPSTDYTGSYDKLSTNKAEINIRSTTPADVKASTATISAITAIDVTASTITAVQPIDIMITTTIGSTSPSTTTLSSAKNIEMIMTSAISSSKTDTE